MPLSYLGEVADVSFKKLLDCLWRSVVIVQGLLIVPTTVIKTRFVDHHPAWVSQIRSENYEPDSQFS